MNLIACEGALKGATVLIVEDEFLLAHDLASACTAAGGRVEGPFPNCDVPLRMIDGALFDAAVLDIKLEGETSYPLAEILQWRSIPFVFATGYDTRTIPARLRTAPVWQKPYSSAFLMQGLATMLDLRGGCERRLTISPPR